MKHHTLHPPAPYTLIIRGGAGLVITPLLQIAVPKRGGLWLIPSRQS